MSAAAQVAFVADVAWASGIEIPARIVDSEAAANVVVPLIAGASEFDCGGSLGVDYAFLDYSLSGGLVSGGTMRFNSVGLARQRTRRQVVLHAFGILGHSPLPGADVFAVAAARAGRREDEPSLRGWVSTGSRPILRVRESSAEASPTAAPVLRAIRLADRGHG